MFVTHTWYVGARSGEVGGKPLGRSICGRRVAFFRDHEGKARAIDALCPHRGADLASGWLVDGTLQCPFHGFRYNGSGRCVEVPSQRDQSYIPQRLGVHSYPVVEQQGFLWIWPARDAAPDRDPPRWDFFEPEPKSGYRRYQCKTELYPTSYVNTLDNALDPGHLPYVHKASIPGAMRLVGNSRLKMAEDRRGYSGEDDPGAVVEEEDRRQKVRWSTGRSLLDSLTRTLATPFLEMSPSKQAGFFYDLSGMVCFNLDYQDGKRDYVLALITPGEENATWFFAEQVRNRALNPVGDWVTKRFMDVLVAEDRDALKLLLPEAQNAGGLRHPALVQGDRASTPFRSIYGAALRREGKQPPWATGSNDATDISHGPAVFNDSQVGRQTAMVGSG